MQYSDEKPADPIRLMVYTGADGRFTLYEDENVNYNYEKGEFAEIAFEYDEAKHLLTIGERKGEFDGMLQERTFEIVWVKKDKRIPLDLDKAPDVTIRYDGSAEVVHVK